jgi:hypothetical protein
VIYCIASALFDVHPQSYDFILSQNGETTPEDLSPSLFKLGVLPDGYIIQNVSGIRTHVVRRLDGKGYDIRKRTIDQHSVTTDTIADMLLCSGTLHR